MSEVSSSIEATYEHTSEAISGEIERIQSEETRPGWNNWVLGAALAAIVWLGFEQLEKLPNMRATLSLMIGYAWAWSATSSVRVTLSEIPEHATARRLRFLPLDSHLAPRRLIPVWMGFKYLVLAVLVSRFGDHLKWFWYIILLANLSGAALFCVAMIISTFTSVALCADRRTSPL
jgi:hypothetical protein